MQFFYNPYSFIAVRKPHQIMQNNPFFVPICQAKFKMEIEKKNGR